MHAIKPWEASALLGWAISSYHLQVGMLGVERTFGQA
jgi:hypothetical protein